MGYTLAKYMIMDVIGALNSSVNANCSPSTPNIIIMGFRASIPMHYQIPFGTIGIGKTPLNREKDDQPRGALSMLMGRGLSSQRSFKVLVLSTQRVIHVSSFTPIPLDRTVIHSLDEMATGNDEEENDEDPLAEESETFQNDPLEPSVMDLAEHQGYEDAALDEGLVPLQPLLPVRSHTNAVRLDGNTPAAPLPDEGAAPSQEDIPQFADMSPPATTPVPTPAPIRRARPAIKVTISPGVSERRTTDTGALEPCKTSGQQLPLHLILGHKFDAHGKYTKTKARIVIGGNLQHRDEDLNTSSFCVRVQSILLLLGALIIRSSPLTPLTSKPRICTPR